MTEYSNTQRNRSRKLRFVRRIHGMRMLGTALCALPIGSVLAEREAPLAMWILVGINALLWPQIAHWISIRARNPVAAQFRCLSLDSAFSGMWIAFMAVSVAPTALFVTMATADKIAAGGWRLLGRSTVALACGFLLTWTLLGFPFQPLTSQRTLLLTIPFLFVYTVVLSMVTHRLGSRIAEQKRELQRLNRTDPTMQLPNRPHLEEVAATELERFHRLGRPATLLLDVDRFKTINDRYGHGMGDVVLKRIAAILRQSVRGTDLPARYGGDEFAVLLVDTDTAKAGQVAERIRSEAERQVFDAEPGLRCSLSIGVAAATAQDASLDSWVRAADAALYRAKAAGRNRVVTA
ncbi:diguanylate cyclase [Luteimonas sp. A611]